MEGSYLKAAKFYEQVVKGEDIDLRMIDDAKACLPIKDLYDLVHFVLGKATSFYNKKYYDLSSMYASLGIQLLLNLPMNSANVPRFEVLLFELYHLMAWVSLQHDNYKKAKIYCKQGIRSAQRSSLISEGVKNPGKNLALLANIHFELEEYNKAKSNYILAHRLEPTNPRAITVGKSLRDLKLSRSRYIDVECSTSSDGDDVSWTSCESTSDDNSESKHIEELVVEETGCGDGHGDGYAKLNLNIMETNKNNKPKAYYTGKQVQRQADVTTKDKDKEGNKFKCWATAVYKFMFD